MYKIASFRIAEAKTTKEVIDWGLMAHNVPDVWKISKASGVKLAVLDTGYDVGHPDLQSNVIHAADFTGSKYGVADKNGHGTHCCGVIAGISNGVGVVGVAPEASLIVAKVLGDNGTGYGPWIANGIRWAVAMGADIISMSLGSSREDHAITNAIKYAYSRNVAVICAAGNSGDGRTATTELDYPAAIKETISVGATSFNDRIARFSNSNDFVDVAAPGVQILSCYPKHSYARLSGTSMACPFVAGVVALALAKHKMQGGKTPMDTVEQVREHIIRFSEDRGELGKDDAYGYGVINPIGMLD